MKLSVVVLTKNEGMQIKGCLDSIHQMADEIIVVDSGSTDKTLEFAKRYNAKIFTDKSDDFSRKRNLGLEKAEGEWVLYIDADERVAPELREEIESGIRSPTDGEARLWRLESGISAYKVPRKNFYFGNHQWPHIEKIERLFKKNALKEWRGQIHESPIIDGQIGELKNYLLHYTHRDLSSMIEKTIEWSKIEAELRFEAGHPQVSWWRFPRVMLTEFYRSYIKQGGWRAGMVGIIESLYQAFSIFVTYARLWEMQQEKLKSHPPAGGSKVKSGN